METFEFLVTSTVQATLYEYIKIQALNYEDAVTRIKDRDYYEEDGEIIDSKTEIDDYLEVDDISNWEDIVESNPKSEESLWTSEY
jgi:hypothetical protein